MDASYVTAIAALLGTVVGGLTSFASTWMTQRYQGQRERIASEIAKRETLYTEYINESSRLLIDAIQRDLEQTESFVSMISLLARMRLFATEPVLKAAEALGKAILDAYMRPNMTVPEIREVMKQARREDGPMDAFSDACREELQKLARGL